LDTSYRVEGEKGRLLEARKDTSDAVFKPENLWINWAMIVRS